MLGFQEISGNAWIRLLGTWRNAYCLRKIRGDLQTKHLVFFGDLQGILRKIRFHDGKSLSNLSFCPGIFIGISFANYLLKEVTSWRMDNFLFEEIPLDGEALGQRYFLGKTMFSGMFLSKQCDFISCSMKTYTSRPIPVKKQIWKNSWLSHLQHLIQTTSFWEMCLPGSTYLTYL